ncbi:helix-turn-helix domain-containing protein, partial [Pseudomonas aeruginosa]
EGGAYEVLHKRLLEQGQRWHVSRVAEQLGISRNTLYRKLRRHGLVRGQA